VNCDILIAVTIQLSGV